MQTACWEMPWLRALRAVALMLAVVLGLEWTVPLGGYAQPNQDPASAPAATVGKQDLPPIQEAEAGEEDRPIYKKFMVSPLALPRIVLLFQKRTHYNSIVQMRKGPSGIICMWHEHLLKDTVNTWQAVFESNRAALCAACHINDLPEAPHLRTSPPRPWQRSV